MSIYTSQLKHTFTIVPGLLPQWAKLGKQVSLLLFQE